MKCDAVNTLLNMVKGLAKCPFTQTSGHPLSWEESGQMLMSHEGWQFKLEIFDPSDEV